MWPGIEDTEVFGIIKRCMEERTPFNMENEFAYPDGSKGWFELSILPVPEGVFILSIDITERKQAEEKLRRDEVKGKDAANRTHREVGAKVRQTIRELGGTMPEELPVVESIKKIETQQRKRLGNAETSAKKKSEDK